MVRLRRPRSVLGLILVLAVGLSACALGDDGNFTDETGHQAELLAARQDLELPPGAEWPEYRALDGSHEVGGGRSAAEFQALCLWQEYWLEVRGTDAAEEERAWRWLEEYPNLYSFRHAMEDRGRARYMQLLEQGELGDPSGIANAVEGGCR